jgi:hypothetical protein
MSQQEPTYNIPAKFRRMENMHIIFWLLKDISWCMIWRTLGVAMIVPTLAIAIYIAWTNRQIVSELCHNLAIAFWITANSYWMISEFFHFDTVIIYGEWTAKHLAIIPFALGMIVLAAYYLFLLPAEKKKKHVVTM